MRSKNIFNFLIKIPVIAADKTRVVVNFSLFKISKDWVILNRVSMKLRPFLWKVTGCQVGKNVKMGYDIYYDVHNASLITIEDNVWIASRSLLLCHKRDLKNYRMYDDYHTLPYTKSPVILRRGCVVGMGSIVMPGVTVGEGAIVAAGSVVVHDVLPWTIVAGNPATKLRDIDKRRAGTTKVIRMDSFKNGPKEVLENVST